ncbi:hypothetical protein ACSBR2_014877 [Camellia fascicularis]
MDEEVRKHMEMHWHGKNEVIPLMKTLKFNIISSLIFGIERGARRDALRGLFQNMIEGMLSVPVNLLSLRARAKMKTILMDLITLLSDEEIEDNAVIIMIKGYDTSSILLTFLIRLLANEPFIYAAIVQEQEEIAKSKTLGGLLPWDDLTKMYTRRVALETLKDNPSWVVWETSMTHMDEMIFPNPSKIDPTHFEQQAPALPYCFMAFGGGPRMCHGYEFARIETLAMIHYLVTQFTCKLSCIDDSFCRNPMPVFNQGLPIHIKQRNLMVQFKFT